MAQNLINVSQPLWIIKESYNTAASMQFHSLNCIALEWTREKQKISFTISQSKCSAQCVNCVFVCIKWKWSVNEHGIRLLLNWYCIYCIVNVHVHCSIGFHWTQMTFLMFEIRYFWCGSAVKLMPLEESSLELIERKDSSFLLSGKYNLKTIS